MTSATKEARQAQKQLNRDIYKLVSRYYDDYGLRVTDINIEAAYTMLNDQQRHLFIKTKIEL